MRRGARYFFGFVSLLSMLLCAATILFWVRSHWVWDDVYFLLPPEYTSRSTLPYVCDIRSSAGGVGLGTARSPGPLPGAEIARIKRNFPAYIVTRIDSAPIYPRPDLSPRHLGISWARAGFGLQAYSSQTEFATYQIRRYFFPYALPAGVFAILPAVWMVVARRQRRIRGRVKRGLCPACGYDLRASTDRCPECGRRIDTRAAAASK